MTATHSTPPKTVLFVIWSLGLGGAEQVVLRLASGLDRRQFTPLICCLNEPGVFATHAERAGIEVIALHKRGAVDLKMLIRLVRLMRERRVEIVHSHLWGANFWGRLAAGWAGVPAMIAHEHGMQPWRGRFHFLMDRWLAGRTNRILFASAQVMDGYLKQTGIAAAKCLVIPNGVAVSEVAHSKAELRRQLGWSDHERVVVSVGRLSPEKGYDDLLTAFAATQRQFPSARLVLIGDGDQRPALQQLQGQLGLNGEVTFAGLQDDVSRWLAAADVYVQPSRREGLPLAVLEAMAAGLPVIATRVGDLGQLITDGRTGYLVPAEHPEALAQILTHVLTHLNQQWSVIEAAQQTVRQHYSSESMVRAVERVYADACGARP